MLVYDKLKIREALTRENIFDLLQEFGGDPGREVFGFTSSTICHNPPGEGSRKLYYYENTGLFKCFTGCDESRKPPLEYPFCTRGMRDSDSSPHLDGQLREHARSHAGWSEPGVHLPEDESRRPAL